MVRRQDFMKMAEAGAKAGSGSRHMKRKQDAINRALVSKSKAEAAKILRRIK